MPGNEEMILRYIDLHGGEIDDLMHFGVMHGVQWGDFENSKSF